MVYARSSVIASNFFILDREKVKRAMRRRFDKHDVNEWQLRVTNGFSADELSLEKNWRPLENVVELPSPPEK